LYQMFVCEAATGANETETEQHCECLNECEVKSFSTAISSGKLSPNVILEDIPASSDIPDRYITALETRHRVVESHLIKALSRLNAAIVAHEKMRFRVNTDIIDAGTSWPTQLSKLFTNFDRMLRGHVADCYAALEILTDVYWEHVDYLVTGLTSMLERLDSETAEVHMVLLVARSPDSYNLVDRLAVLKDRNDDAWMMAKDFEGMLLAEAMKSKRQWHYFPNPLLVDGCGSTFRDLTDSLDWQWFWLYEFIPMLNGSSTVPPVNQSVFTDMAGLRAIIVATKECLLSYKEELNAFRDQLDDVATVEEAEFSYDPPTTAMLKFNMAGLWLISLGHQYVQGFSTKRRLAEDLHSNGSEVVNIAEQLYSDIELSLFTKVTSELDTLQGDIVTFYRSLLQQVTTIQRYMYANDTSLEQLMRGLSIWRMPIVNYQKSQVLRLRFDVMQNVNAFYVCRKFKCK